jgi:hypothetical protein
MCVIDWSAIPAQISAPAAGRLDDGTLLAAMTAPDVAKVAIDAPFGFPAAFVDALTSYQAGGRWLPLDASELRFRATEHHVKAVTGQQALSAVTDDLVWPAMRCARLLSQLPDHPVDRMGRGLVVEVYPAAALRHWVDPGLVAGGLPSYKGDKPGRQAQREAILASLVQGLAGVLEVSPVWTALCTDSDDHLDALVCAMIARAAHNGNLRPVPVGSRWAAIREGWIALPNPELGLAAALASSSPPAD